MPFACHAAFQCKMRFNELIENVIESISHLTKMMWSGIDRYFELCLWQRNVAAKTSSSSSFAKWMRARWKGYDGNWAVKRRFPRQKWLLFDEKKKKGVCVGVGKTMTKKQLEISIAWWVPLRSSNKWEAKKADEIPATYNLVKWLRNCYCRLKAFAGCRGCFAAVR